nr:protein IWS1 homolog [Cherax quadricarinatus]
MDTKIMHISNTSSEKTGESSMNTKCKESERFLSDSKEVANDYVEKSEFEHEAGHTGQKTEQSAEGNTCPKVISETQDLKHEDTVSEQETEEFKYELTMKDSKQDNSKFSQATVEFEQQTKNSNEADQESLQTKLETEYLKANTDTEYSTEFRQESTNFKEATNYYEDETNSEPVTENSKQKAMVDEDYLDFEQENYLLWPDINCEQEDGSKMEVVGSEKENDKNKQGSEEFKQVTEDSKENVSKLENKDSKTVLILKDSKQGNSKFIQEAEDFTQKYSNSKQTVQNFKQENHLQSETVCSKGKNTEQSTEDSHQNSKDEHKTGNSKQKTKLNEDSIDFEYGDYLLWSEMYYEENGDSKMEVAGLKNEYDKYMQGSEELKLIIKDSEEKDKRLKTTDNLEQEASETKHTNEDFKQENSDLMHISQECSKPQHLNKNCKEDYSKPKQSTEDTTQEYPIVNSEIKDSKKEDPVYKLEAENSETELTVKDSGQDSSKSRQEAVEFKQQNNKSKQAIQKFEQGDVQPKLETKYCRDNAYTEDSLELFEQEGPCCKQTAENYEDEPNSEHVTENSKQKAMLDEDYLDFEQGNYLLWTDDNCEQKEESKMEVVGSEAKNDKNMQGSEKCQQEPHCDKQGKNKAYSQHSDFKHKHSTVKEKSKTSSKFRISGKHACLIDEVCKKVS